MGVQLFQGTSAYRSHIYRFIRHSSAWESRRGVKKMNNINKTEDVIIFCMCTKECTFVHVQKTDCQWDCRSIDSLTICRDHSYVPTDTPFCRGCSLKIKKTAAPADLPSCRINCDVRSIRHSEFCDRFMNNHAKLWRGNDYIGPE
jgi:hypothetical protein